MTCYPAEVTKPGELVIHYKSADGNALDFRIGYDKDQLKASVEKVVLDNPEDKGVIEHWGDNIYRINFKSTHPKTSEKISFEIAAK
jgi:hypothetical protein